VGGLFAGIDGRASSEEKDGCGFYVNVESFIKEP
jgi:hypothetical protein